MQRRVHAPLFEAVPNFSEGRDGEKISRIVAAVRTVEGVRVLGLHSDVDHNRSVLTLAGEEGPILKAAVALAEACAAEIDLASQAGVKIEMVIRGICCLKPGLEGISENIRVVSLVGRFLEHARIFAFGEEYERVYLGSADWMQRNLDRRVENVFHLREERHRQKVRRLMDLQLADTANGWKLNPDGSYERHHPKEGEEPLDSQALLLEEPF